MKWKWSGTPGMDLHDALSWACHRLNENTGPRTYLEIGVDGGESLRTVLRASKRRPSVTLIDPFDKDHEGHGFKNFDHIAPIAKAASIAPPTLHQGDSAEVVPLLHYRDMFDLITIDGDHSLEAATLDLANCWPHLNREGILVFDDVGHVKYPWLKIVLEQFLSSVKDAVLIEEEGAPFRNCAVLTRFK